MPLVLFYIFDAALIELLYTFLLFGVTIDLPRFFMCLMWVEQLQYFLSIQFNHCFDEIFCTFVHGNVNFFFWLAYSDKIFLLWSSLYILSVKCNFSYRKTLRFTVYISYYYFWNAIPRWFFWKGGHQRQQNKIRTPPDHYFSLTGFCVLHNNQKS